MTYKLIIQGKLKSMNEFIGANRTNGVIGNAMKQSQQNIVSLYIMQQLKDLHIDKPIRLHYDFYEQNKRRDMDNVSSYARKVIQDALVNCQVIKNDGWGYIQGSSEEFYIDKKNPRIEIAIKEEE